MNPSANFDVDEFNKKFEREMELSKKKTSEVLEYELPDKTVLRVDKRLIDPALTNGKNYTDPTKPDFIDPNTDSKDRLALLALVDRYRKRVLVLLTGKRNEFVIPGTYAKLVEPYRNAAARGMENYTGVKIDKEKTERILCLKDNNGLEICTYLCYSFDVRNMKKKKVKWVPIFKLYYYNDIYFATYYRFVYHAVMKALY